ncbi:uncharacterized protein [Hyperolius riggenbachi]|uniref:uncharacterized protein isoform X2 n=1 Tax=Hyperolius riggenbachi TaxID=752182 RepID=UPI0035A2C61A
MVSSTLCRVLLLLVTIYGANTAPNVALRGISTQSSTYSYYGNARNAHDGSLANNYLRSQCSYTEKDHEPWWMVDLKIPHKVMSVAITNRILECCKERIFGAVVHIGNDPSKGGTLNPRCGVISSIESGETISFSCQGMTGQYVSIAIPERAEHLILCEVQVYGLPADSLDNVMVPNDLKTPNGAPNVAIKGVAQQSSLYSMFGESKNAIDGSLDNNFYYIQCASTGEQDNPWWMVDLKGKFKIFTVAVTSRGDCCADKLNGAKIRIGDLSEDGGTKNPICGAISSMSSGETMAVECDGMTGQYVTITIPGKNKTLAVCEVQVFGLPSDVSDDTPKEEENYPGFFFPGLWILDDLWKEYDFDDDYGDDSSATDKKDSEGENLAFRGISSQSSTYDKFGDPENAIDGSVITRYMSKHCSHTDLDIEPWWRVDLTKVFNITKVKILNRGDCCAERIEGAEIKIGNSPEKGGTRNPRCAKISSLGLGKEEEYICGIVGQYVTVTIPGRAAYLTLCEVKVYGTELPDNYTILPYYPGSSQSTEDEQAEHLKGILKHTNAAPNVALNGQSDQSSTDGGDSSKAIDGILSSCAKTTSQSHPWWSLDLTALHKVFFVVLTNSRDATPGNLDGAEIHIGNSATSWKKNPVCGTVSSIGPGETFSFSCDGMEGRYVTVVLPEEDKALILCEVQVFGLHVDTPSGDWNGDLELQMQHHGAKNVALRGIAYQSSHYSTRSNARKAIDGSLSSNYMAGQCTHTKSEKEPWWMVDLTSNHRVQSIAITNRGDCCRERINGAEILVGNSAKNGGIANARCGTVFRMQYGETMSFNCRGMEGRYVSIYIPHQTQFLSLCEVQVFAEPAPLDVVLDPQPTGAPALFPKGEEASTQHPVTDLTGKYFLFPKESEDTYITLAPAIPLRLNAFTFCMRVSLDVPNNRETILFSYRTLYFDELNLWLESNGKIGLYMSGEGLMFPQVKNKKAWNHMCLTWESKNGRCELWVNGRRKANMVYRKQHTVRDGGIAMLGQDQDSLGGNFDKEQSFVGKIKDVKMWNRVLSLRGLKAMFKGRENPKGNIFDWSELNYSTKGSVQVEETN